MRSLALAMALGVTGAAASADVIAFDFEEFRGNTNNTAGDHIALRVDEGGLYALITRTSGERFTVWNSQGEDVPSAWGAKHLSPVFNYFMDDYMVMSFSAPLRWARVEFGDYGQDDDLAELYAYTEIQAGGDLLGMSSEQLGDRDMRWDAPVALTFEAAPGEEIWSIKFRGGQDPFLQSTFIDNIVVETIPTPGALALLGLTLGALAGVRRRGSRR